MTRVGDSKICPFEILGLYHFGARMRGISMALIFCPQCRNEVSDRASSCPHCQLSGPGSALDPNESREPATDSPMRVYSSEEISRIESRTKGRVKKASRWRLLVLVVVLAGLGVFALVRYAFPSAPRNDSEFRYFIALEKGWPWTSEGMSDISFCQAVLESKGKGLDVGYLDRTHLEDSERKTKAYREYLDTITPPPMLKEYHECLRTHIANTLDILAALIRSKVLSTKDPEVLRILTRFSEIEKEFALKSKLPNELEDKLMKGFKDQKEAAEKSKREELDFSK